MAKDRLIKDIRTAQVKARAAASNPSLTPTQKRAAVTEQQNEIARKANALRYSKLSERDPDAARRMRVQQEVQHDVAIAQRAASKPGLTAEQRRDIVVPPRWRARSRLRLAERFLANQESSSARRQP